MEAAKYLNGHLFVPSDCFKFFLPHVFMAIVSGKDLVSINLALSLAEQIKEKVDVEPRVIISEKFNDLDSNGFCRVSELLNNLNGEKLCPNETLLVTTEGNVQILKDLQVFVGYSFVSRQRLMTQKDHDYRNFILFGDRKWEGTKLLCNFDYVVAYDDDPTSAIVVVKDLWWDLYHRFGVNGPSGKRRKLVCVGGCGKMSSFLYRKLMPGKKLSEADLQKITATLMYVSPEDIITVSGGRNTGDNLRNLSGVIGGTTAIMAVTQRLSAIVKYSQTYQFPEMKLSYYTIYEKAEQSMKLMNGMALAGGKPLLHYWAHVVRRWESYSDTSASQRFMSPVIGIDEIIEANAEYLEKRYLIKQPGWSVQKVLQYVPILWDLFFGKGKLVPEDYREHVSEARGIIQAKYGHKIDAYYGRNGEEASFYEEREERHAAF